MNFVGVAKVVDIFPIGSDHPLRINLDDQVIEQIGQLNVTEQTVGQKVDQFTMLRRQEFPFDEAARQYFCAQFIDRFNSTSFPGSLAHNAEHAIMSPGFDSFLPLFFSQLASFFDYIPANAKLVTSTTQQNRSRLSTVCCHAATPLSNTIRSNATCLIAY